MSSGRKAFTLVEVLVAVALVGIGVVAVMGALSSLTKAQVRMLEREQMQRLALQKYEELVATGEYTTSSSGDFSDRNEARFQWDSTVDATGVENLQALTIRVFKPQSEETAYERFTGLIFRPATTGAAQ